MTCHETQIDRLSFGYWLWGKDAHMSRFHCTSEDWLLAIVTMILTTWMCFEYCKVFNYKMTWGEVLEKSPEKDYVLAVVFLLCGIVHFANDVIGWLVPLYWPKNVAVFFCSLMTHKLNRFYKKSVEKRTEGCQGR